MSTNVSTPPPRDQAQEGRDSMLAQLELAPEQLAARQKFDPQYSDLNIEVLRRSLFGAKGKPGLLATYQEVEPLLTRMTAEAQTGQRERDIADVERFGGRASSAFRNADPGAAEIEDKLQSQAMEELDAGASLDPALRNQVVQGVRAGQASRGFGMGLSDANTEGLFIGREAEAMRRSRQGFASGVAAQRRSANVDPFLAVLGRQSAVPGMAGSVVGEGRTSATAGAPDFNPWNAYSADVANTNFNAKSAAAIANANNSTAISGAAIGAAGSAASAL